MRKRLTYRLSYVPSTEEDTFIFQKYDVVEPMLTDERSIMGVVYNTNTAEGKIYVKWMTGKVSQVSSDEIRLIPFVDGEVREKLTQLADSAMASEMRTAERDMSKERVPSLLLRLETFVTRSVTGLPAAPISIQMLKSLRAVRWGLKYKMRLRGRQAVLAFAQACRGHFDMGSLPLATLGTKYGNNLIRGMLIGQITAEVKNVDKQKVAAKLLRLAKGLLAATIRKGDICRVILNKIDRSDFGTGHFKKILRKIIKEGDGFVQVKSISGGEAEIVADGNPMSSIVFGGVNVNVEALRREYSVETLTTRNIKPLALIRNKRNPYWGRHVVQEQYGEGMWNIRGDRGGKVLYKNDLKDWELLDSV